VVVAASARYTVVQGGRRLGAGASTRALADAYGAALRRLRRAAPHVAVLTDSPRPPLDVPGCVSAAMKHLRRCAFRRGKAVAASAPIDAAVRRAQGISTIDPTSRFCLPDLCPAVIGDVLVYRNSGHVTASFIATLAPWLARRLPRVSGLSRDGASERPVAGAARQGRRSAGIPLVFQVVEDAAWR
jgi:hypothetical protein